MSLKNHLKSYIYKCGTVSRRDILQHGRDYKNTLDSTTDRCLRTICKEEPIHAIKNQKKHIVEYTVAPTKEAPYHREQANTKEAPSLNTLSAPFPGEYPAIPKQYQ